MFISKKKYESEKEEWARKYSELETKYVQSMFLCEEKDKRINELEKEIDETDTMFDSCLRKLSIKIREELETRKNRRDDADFFFFSC